MGNKVSAGPEVAGEARAHFLEAAWKGKLTIPDMVEPTVAIFAFPVVADCLIL